MIEGLDVMEGTGGFSEPPRYILYEIEEDVGDESDVGIPGNIPNPEVKRVNADGTWRATSWESRKLPTTSFFVLTESQERRDAGPPALEICRL